jgi:phenylpropionate dioxygenase-like ring-hydroxylating dioxygenase large terminal subunit
MKWSLMMMTTVHITNAFFAPDFYYQVYDSRERPKINRLTISDTPYVSYRYNNSYTVLTDKCPHQGASLSKGWVNPMGNIHCPYHAFEFDRTGSFVGIPNPSMPTPISVFQKKKHKKCLTPYPVFDQDYDMFVAPTNRTNILLPYYPPEHYNDEFVRTRGNIIINKDHQVVTENVLDMLHISYVHSFGNRESPLPFDVSFRKLSPTSGRSIFRYKPFKYTISNQVGKTPIVVVENEYHLPTTTITRVTAGNVVKTVMTRSTPISSGKTQFFWSVYRNFWCSKDFPFINVLGDILITFLMNRTLQEDINILKDVYPEARVGTVITKYDVTIQQYRKTLQDFKYHDEI